MHTIFPGMDGEGPKKNKLIEKREKATVLLNFFRIYFMVSI